MPKRTKMYHYVITIECPPINRMGTYEGTIEVLPDRTRHDVFMNRYEFACQQAGTNINSTFVRCWVLEPNDL